jgi:hypothetical protein
MANFTHDPDADLDYGFSWATWLGADTITTSTWTISKIAPEGVDATLVLSASTHDATPTTIWADGGTSGKTYTITNHIITAAGREDDRSHVLACKPR